VSNFTIEWIDRMREPRCAPDPAYPEGKDADMTLGAARTCKVDLPYPAKRCGIYIVACGDCGLRVGITTAGRPDDPRSATLPCHYQDLNLRDGCAAKRA
jgi:hypothetical protein